MGANARGFVGEGGKPRSADGALFLARSLSPFYPGGRSPWNARTTPREGSQCHSRTGSAGVLAGPLGWQGASGDVGTLRIEPPSPRRKPRFGSKEAFMFFAGWQLALPVPPELPQARTGKAEPALACRRKTSTHLFLPRRRAFSGARSGVRRRGISTKASRVPQEPEPRCPVKQPFV